MNETGNYSIGIESEMEIKVFNLVFDGYKMEIKVFDWVLDGYKMEIKVFNWVFDGINI